MVGHEETGGERPRFTLMAEDLACAQKDAGLVHRQVAPGPRS